jgi:citrate lyase beta subunit
MTKQTPIRVRSWLFTPATRLERFAKASQAGADVAILDLEDHVAPGDKARATSTLSTARTMRPPGPSFARQRQQIVDSDNLQQARSSRGTVCSGVKCPDLDKE